MSTLRRVFAVGSAAVWLALLAPFVIGGCSHPGPAPTMGPNAGAPVDPAKAPAPLVGHNLLYNEGFTQGARALPWSGEFGNGAEGKARITNGELCMEVRQKGKARWDAQLKQQHIHLQKGHHYAVQFKMHATAETRVYLKIGDAGPPYKEFYKLLFTPGPTPKVYAGSFTMTGPDDAGVEFALHMGGQLAKAALPFTVCLDDTHLDDPEYTPVPEPSPPPVLNVLVNQVGYLPALAKIAIVKNPTATPWTLLNAKGESVASGVTIPFGDDHDSGEKVSAADFTGTTQEGTGYTLKVGNDTSHPFDIGPGIYRKLKYDALAYFYQTRSGIEIKMPYAGDPKWAHPAGHVGVKPNHGDSDVPCAPGSGCDYKLDVTGGWYDAGDHGKYLISAGISVWTLLNWWEREKAFGTLGGRLRRREDEHPRERERRPRPARRGPLGAGVRAQDAGPRGESARRDGPRQDPRRQLDAARARAARGSDGALPSAPDHRRVAEPGGQRRAGGARLEEDRSGILGEVPGGRGARLGSGGRSPGSFPVQGWRRRRAL